MGSPVYSIFPINGRAATKLKKARVVTVLDGSDHRPLPTIKLGDVRK
jgi:hypothetical protein